MTLWKFVAADICLGVAAFFGLVVVTAPDHLTTTQAVIAWVLLVVLILLAIALLATLVVGVRRLAR